MGNLSTEWLAAISTGRDYSIDEKKKRLCCSCDALAASAGR